MLHTAMIDDSASPDGSPSSPTSTLAHLKIKEENDTQPLSPSASSSVPSPLHSPSSASSSNRKPSSPVAKRPSDLEHLFIRIAGWPNVYDPSDVAFTQRRVRQLFEADYEISIVQNKDGSLCNSYPTELILASERVEDPSLRPFVRSALEEKARVLQTIIADARFSRVHGRFPFPVVFFNGKIVARSGTIALGHESFIRNVSSRVKSTFSKLYKSLPSISLLDSSPSSAPQPISDPSSPSSPASSSSAPGATAFATMATQREADLQLLSKIGVRHVCDLMLEVTRKLYGTLPLCTSEKSPDLTPFYSTQCSIESMPYPGREWFKLKSVLPSSEDRYITEWKESDWEAKRSLSVPVPDINQELQQRGLVNLIEITTHYFKAMLQYLADSDDKSTGVLVHCLSGWDRTPLFVALLRITLWADDLAHTSLSVDEMLELVVSYDYMLFHHAIKERLERKEEIMRFCFEYLQFIEGQEYSFQFIQKQQQQQSSNPSSPSTPSSSSSSTPPESSLAPSPSSASSSSSSSSGSKRQEKLRAIRERFLTLYQNCTLSTFVRLYGSKNGAESASSL